MSTATSTIATPELATAAASPEPRLLKHGEGTAVLPAPVVVPAATGIAGPIGFDLLGRHKDTVRETFLPVTKAALIDRLCHAEAWPDGQAKDARRLFQYLDHWRRQLYFAGLRDIDRLYETFNPDSDLLATRAFSDAEKARMQGRVVDHMKMLLKQANFVQVMPEEIDILTQGSYYGLELKLDLDAFDELLVYYRGRSTRKEQRRQIRKFYRRIEFSVPIFRRLFVLFKLKPTAKRVEELVRDKGMSRKEAEREVKRLRGGLAAHIKSDNIYMKLFKNMPRSDLEMVFPNTRVNFRLFDKVKLGVTGGAGLGMGMFSAAGKLALAASNPVAAVGAVAGLGGIAVRQGVNFINQRQRYMVVMAQNLYFHAMADNGSAMIMLADRAAEEDVKEEMLLYSVIAKAPVMRRELGDVDRGVERYIKNVFDVDVDFDLDEALGRLINEGLVTETDSGELRALPPAEAARHLDAKWDVFLDNLVDDEASLGVEVET